MRLMRLAHSQIVCMIFLHPLLLCQIFKWGRHSEGAHREGEALTPSTSPACVLSAHTLACSPARSWLLQFLPEPQAWEVGIWYCKGPLWGLLVWDDVLTTFSLLHDSPHLELWLGEQQHSRKICVLTGVRISRTHVFSFCGSTNFSVSL